MFKFINSILIELHIISNKLLMANSTKIVLICVLVFLLLSSYSNAHSLKACKFKKIYQFGDSMSDTGNLVLENPNTPFSHFPYGESFSKNATGRCSNGLLMIDYFGIFIFINLIDLFLFCFRFLILPFIASSLITFQL